MAIHHLTLPEFNEPPLRIPVVARYGGPVLAAMRRHAGYQFTGPGPNSSEGHLRAERAAQRRI